MQIAARSIGLRACSQALNATINADEDPEAEAMLFTHFGSGAKHRESSLGAQLKPCVSALLGSSVLVAILGSQCYRDLARRGREPP